MKTFATSQTWFLKSSQEELISRLGIDENSGCAVCAVMCEHIGSFPYTKGARSPPAKACPSPEPPPAFY